MHGIVWHSHVHWHTLQYSFIAFAPVQINEDIFGKHLDSHFLKRGLYHITLVIVASKSHAFSLTTSDGQLQCSGATEHLPSPILEPVVVDIEEASGSEKLVNI
jgi:glycogen synthase